MRYEVHWSDTFDVADTTTTREVAELALSKLRSHTEPAITFVVREAQRHAHGKSIILTNIKDGPPSPDELVRAAERDALLREMLSACHQALTSFIEQNKDKGKGKGKGKDKDKDKDKGKSG